MLEIRRLNYHLCPDLQWRLNTAQTIKMPVATVTSAPQNKEQLSMRVRVLETVILSCYLLFWILIVIRQLHSWRYFDNFGTVISEDSPEVSLEHNDKVCSDKMDLSWITSISVPLVRAWWTRSSKNLKQKMWQQKTFPRYLKNTCGKTPLCSL